LQRNIVDPADLSPAVPERLVQAGTSKNLASPHQIDKLESGMGERECR